MSVVVSVIKVPEVRCCEDFTCVDKTTLSVQIIYSLEEAVDEEFE
jgi:hypothetical protein